MSVGAEPSSVFPRLLKPRSENRGENVAVRGGGSGALKLDESGASVLDFLYCCILPRTETDFVAEEGRKAWSNMSFRES